MPVYVGDILTATPASVSGKPVPQLTWQWLRNGVAIVDATEVSYEVTTDDIGSEISVMQIETNLAGFDTAISLTTGVVLP